MSTLVEQLLQAVNSKNALKEVLVAQGANITAETPFSQYATLVLSINTSNSIVSLTGAVGDGVTDDTAAILAALDALQPGQTLRFEANKIYKVHTLTCPIISNKAALYVHNHDITLDLNHSTILLASNSGEGSAIILLLLCKNVTVTRGYLIGDRQTHDYHITTVDGSLHITDGSGNITTHEGCNHGVMVMSSKNCTLEYLYIKDCPGDGISFANDYPCYRNDGDGYYATPARWQYAGGTVKLGLGSINELGEVLETVTGIVAVEHDSDHPAYMPISYLQNVHTQSLNYKVSGETDVPIKFDCVNFGLDHTNYNKPLEFYFYDADKTYLGKVTRSVWKNPYLWMSDIPEGSAYMLLYIDGLTSFAKETGEEFNGSWISIYGGGIHGQNNTVNKCIISKCRRQGISCGSVSGLTVSNCMFTYIGEHGLGEDNLANNEVGGCPPGAGIDIEEGKSFENSFTGNEVLKCDYGFVFPGAFETTVKNNFVYDCDFVGYVTGNVENLTSSAKLFLRPGDTFKDCDFSKTSIVFDYPLPVNVKFENCILNDFEYWGDYSETFKAQVKADPNYKLEFVNCTFKKSWDNVL